jgi:dUTP pyrophosphatase
MLNLNNQKVKRVLKFNPFTKRLEFEEIKETLDAVQESQESEQSEESEHSDSLPETEIETNLALKLSKVKTRIERRSVSQEIFKIKNHKLSQREERRKKRREERRKKNSENIINEKSELENIINEKRELENIINEKRELENIINEKRELEKNINEKPKFDNIIEKVLLYSTEKYKLERGTFYSAGYDLPSLNDEVIHPGERKLIKTGIKMEIPNGMFGKIESRSSMSKMKIDTKGGVIDSDYRYDVGVFLENNSLINYVIKSGDRIAQIIIHPDISIGCKEILEVSYVKERTGGFGSTGR